jgi:hypothetical protein
MTPPRDHDRRRLEPVDPLARQLHQWYGATTQDAGERNRQLQAIGHAVHRMQPAALVAREHQSVTSARRLRAGLSSAAALAVLLAGGAVAVRAWRVDSTPSHRPAAPMHTEAGARDVGFALRLPDDAVRRVSLAGDFNGWDTSALPMARDPVDGTWRVRVPLLPGRHTYSFVVDGQRWVIDPMAPTTVEGALGPTNVIAVSGGP